MTMKRFGVVMVAGLALAACHHETKSDDQRTAAGQVLKGSVSDAMISYETLHSQPPLAKGGGGVAAADSADSGAAGDAGAGDDAPAAGEPAPQGPAG